MYYKYIVTIYFRNGKRLELVGNQLSVHKDPGGVSMILMLNKEIIVELPEGIGNTFSVDVVAHYNAFPRPALYDLFPDDWDPKTESFLLIDKILINSFGREQVFGYSRSKGGCSPTGTTGTPNLKC